MAQGVFIVQELRGNDPAGADEAARFEWTADSTAPTPFDGAKGGGARACPLKPWAQAGEQRKVRTNYPNATIPSIQVLGPVDKPHTFRGRWDDRYNGIGYAKFERARFVAMAKRGNPVRVQFDDFAFEGVIESWICDVQRAWDIDYTFTLDVTNEVGEGDPSRSPVTPADALESLNQVDLATQATLDADDLAPRNAIAGTLADDVTTSLVGMVTARESLAGTIDSRDLAPPENPVDQFTRIATQFRAARGAAFGLISRLSAVRSDLDMAQQTAIDVLNFDDWVRSLRFGARIAMGQALAGDIAATEHAEPSAVRLYRPQAGEHLYGIARKFYGSAHAWSLIYDRNSLTTSVMSGNEILLIPERGGI